MDNLSAPAGRGMPRDLAVVALSLFTWGVGEGMFIYFQPLALQRWVSDTRQIGALLGTAGLAMVVAQIPAGMLSDRVGSRPVMWSAWVVGLAATLVMASASSLPVFVAGMLMYSFTSFVSAPLNSYITSMRGRWTVQRSLSSVFAAMYLGGIAGPFLGGWVGTAMGLPSVFRISAVIFTASTAIVLFARKPLVPAGGEPSTSQPAVRAGMSFAGPIRDPRFARLLALFFFTTFALYLPQPLTPVYLGTEHGLDLQQIGLTGTMASIGNTLIMLFLGGLNAPAGMAIGQALGAAFCIFLLRGQSTAAFAAGYLFVGGQRLFRSMTVASAASLARPGETGLAFGLLETASALVVIAAPTAAGFLYNYRPQAVYTASLAAIAIMIVLNALLMPGKERPAQDATQAE